MIRLIQRTVTVKGNGRLLYQQADIDRLALDPNNWPSHLTEEYSCYFCLYRSEWNTISGWQTCRDTHCCNNNQYPYIRMTRPIPDISQVQEQNPDGTILTYQGTGVYKQTTFEAQPHHIHLYLCNNGQAKCNANCWWHGWRLKNKRSAIQCGKTHLCQNDGSLWCQVAPYDSILYHEFIQQL